MYRKVLRAVGKQKKKKKNLSNIQYYNRLTNCQATSCKAACWNFISIFYFYYTLFSIKSIIYLDYIHIDYRVWPKRLQFPVAQVSLFYIPDFIMIFFFLFFLIRFDSIRAVRFD